MLYEVLNRPYPKVSTTHNMIRYIPFQNNDDDDDDILIARKFPLVCLLRHIIQLNQSIIENENMSPFFSSFSSPIMLISL